MVNVNDTQGRKSASFSYDTHVGGVDFRRLFSTPCIIGIMDLMFCSL